MKIKHKKQSFMQGVLTLMFSQVLIKILGLVYKLYLTNREGFGDVGNAIYSSGFQIYALLLTFSSIGVPNAISKLVSERVAIGDNRGAHRIFKVSIFTFSCIGLLGTLLLFFGASYIANVFLQIPEAELTLVALSPSIFFVSLSSVIKGYFNGRENMSATAHSQTFEQGFKTISSIIFVEIIAILSGIDTKLMAAGANLATTFAIFLSFVYLFKYYKTERKIVWQEINSSVIYKRERKRTILKNIVKVSIPLSLSSLMSVINKNVDGVTVVRSLKKFLGETEAKIQYGILSGKVETLISLPFSFNIAFSTALVPSISAAIARGEKKLVIKRISFSLLVTILIGLPCTIVIFVFAEPILNLLFPNASSGKLILQVSAISIVFIVLIQTLDGALQGLGKYSIPIISLGIGAIVKFILNTILVPIETVGIIGAAISSVISQIVSFIIAFVSLKQYLKMKLDILQLVIKPILASVMTGIVSYFCYVNLLTVFSEKIVTILALIVAIIIYMISIFVLRIFKEEDMYMLPYGTEIYKLLKKIKVY